MLLLTYSDKCVPTFSKCSPFKNKASFHDDFCFNSKDIKKFLGRLRTYFKVRKIRWSYFISSEYGEKRTKRPHYHMLLNVGPGSDPQTIMHYIRGCSTRDQYRKLNDDKTIHSGAWSFGHVSPPQYDAFHDYLKLWTPEACTVKDATGIRYCAKYVTKDIHFYKRQILEDFKQSEFYDDYKHLLPAHFQSHGYGKYLSEKILFSKDSIDALSKPVSIMIQGKTQNFNVPRYILNKLIYKNVPVSRYDSGQIRYRRILNDFGYKFKLYQYDTISKKKGQIIDNTLSSSNLQALLSVSPRFKEYFDNSFHSLENFFAFKNYCFTSFYSEYIGSYVTFHAGKVMNPLVELYNSYDDLREIYFCSQFKTFTDRFHLAYNPQLDHDVGIDTLGPFYSDCSSVDFRSLDILNTCYMQYKSCLSECIRNEEFDNNIIVQRLKQKLGYA